MWVITVLVLLAGGLIGASNIVIAKRPDAKDVIDKLIPFQGIIGVVLLLWGVVGVFDILRSLRFMQVSPFWYLVFVATVVTELGLGFLLAYGLITKVTSGQAAAKAGQMHAKLTGYQSSLGVTAIALSVLFFLLTLMRGW
jgi:hypothetical protein